MGNLYFMLHHKVSMDFDIRDKLMDFNMIFLNEKTAVEYLYFALIFIVRKKNRVRKRGPSFGNA